MSVRCKNERYIIDYYPQGAKGKRRMITLPVGTTDKQARQIETDLRGNKSTSHLASQDDKVSSLTSHYYNHIDMHLAISTCKDIRGCFKHHLIPYFGNLRITELTTPLISTYQKIRREQPHIPDNAGNIRKQKAINRSINKELSYFSAFRSWVEAEFGIAPLSPLKFRALPYKRPLPKIMANEEVGAILAHVEDHYKGVVLAIAHLCLRITSARRLRWADVDWKSMTVTAHGKGNKEIQLPLSDELAGWLTKQMARNEYKSPWLFPSSVRPMHPVHDIRKALKRAAEAAGVTKRVHPHLFRHTAAARLLEAGVDIRVVQELLGHSDIRMTAWYTQLMMSSKREAMTKAGHIKRPIEVVKSSKVKKRKILKKKRKSTDNKG